MDLSAGADESTCDKDSRSFEWAFLLNLPSMRDFKFDWFSLG